MKNIQSVDFLYYDYPVFPIKEFTYNKSTGEFAADISDLTEGNINVLPWARDKQNRWLIGILGKTGRMIPFVMVEDSFEKAHELAWKFTPLNPNPNENFSLTIFND